MFMEFRSNESWPQSDAIWQRSYANGLRDILMWIRTEYNNPEVIITENGWAEDELVDVGRVDFIRVSCKLNNQSNKTCYINKSRLKVYMLYY